MLIKSLFELNVKLFPEVTYYKNVGGRFSKKHFGKSPYGEESFARCESVGGRKTDDAKQSFL